MADTDDEREEKSYSFVRPGVLQSRILNRGRQNALGRGLGVLLSTMGPKAQESEQATTTPLPRLEITREEPPQEAYQPRATGVHRNALLSRLQGTHREESGQGFAALFRAVSAATETTPAGLAAQAAVEPSPRIAAASPGAPSGAEGRTATVAGRQFPLASDFLVVMMDLNLIQPNPFVPLSHINREALDRLMGSIKAHGFLRPLVVMPSTLGSVTGGQVYWLISGERSWQVARLLGMDHVPVRVQEVSPREAIQMVLAEEWHLQRLPPMDRAHLCGVLSDQMGMTVEEIAERLAVGVDEITATLAYLQLDSEIQNSLNTGELSEPTARALLPIEDTELREEIWKYALRYQWGPARIERALRERFEEKESS